MTISFFSPQQTRETTSQLQPELSAPTADDVRGDHGLRLVARVADAPHPHSVLESSGGVHLRARDAPAGGGAAANRRRRRNSNSDQDLARDEPAESFRLAHRDSDGDDDDGVLASAEDRGREAEGGLGQQLRRNQLGTALVAVGQDVGLDDAFAVVRQVVSVVRLSQAEKQEEEEALTPVPSTS